MLTVSPPSAVMTLVNTGVTVTSLRGIVKTAVLLPVYHSMSLSVM